MSVITNVNIAGLVLWPLVIKNKIKNGTDTYIEGFFFSISDEGVNTLTEKGQYGNVFFIMDLF